MQIANDKRFCALSDDAQLVFITSLFAHQHMTSMGAMRGSVEGLAAEKRRWVRGRFERAFREIEKARMLYYDPSVCCIVLPNFLKHNEPESPNVVKNWPRAYELIPECKLKVDLLVAARAFLVGLQRRGFVEAFDEAFGMTSRKASSKTNGKLYTNQEQELEQEQEQDSLYPSAADFDTWYAAYPRKVAKEAARKAWLKHRKEMPPLAEMLAKLELQRQSSTWTKDGGEYIPYPATYLNGSRWNDELLPPPTGPGSRPRSVGAERRAQGSDDSRRDNLRRLSEEAGNHD